MNQGKRNSDQIRNLHVGYVCVRVPDFCAKTRSAYPKTQTHSNLTQLKFWKPVKRNQWRRLQRVFTKIYVNDSRGASSSKLKNIRDELNFEHEPQFTRFLHLSIKPLNLTANFLRRKRIKFLEVFRFIFSHKAIKYVRWKKKEF